MLVQLLPVQEWRCDAALGEFESSEGLGTFFAMGCLECPFDEGADNDCELVSLEPRS